MKNKPLSHLKITPCIIKGVPFSALPNQQARLLSLNYLMCHLTKVKRPATGQLTHPDLPCSIYHVAPPNPKFSEFQSNLKTLKASPTEAVHGMKFSQPTYEGAAVTSKGHRDSTGVTGTGRWSTPNTAVSHAPCQLGLLSWLGSLFTLALFCFSGFPIKGLWLG